MKIRKKAEWITSIFILLIIGAITSQIIFSVITKAQEKSRKNSVFGYAEALRLKVYEDTFDASLNAADIDSKPLQNIEGYQVVCEQILYSKTFGVILENCKVGNQNQSYYYALGRVYKDKNDLEFQKIWEYVKEEIK